MLPVHDPVSLSRRLSVQVGTDQKPHMDAATGGMGVERAVSDSACALRRAVKSIFEAGDARLPCTEWSEEATRTAEHRHMAGSFGLGGLSVKPSGSQLREAGSKLDQSLVIGEEQDGRRRYTACVASHLEG